MRACMASASCFWWFVRSASTFALRLLARVLEMRNTHKSGRFFNAEVFMPLTIVLAVGSDSSLLGSEV
jgi:hypothetical protein